MALFLQNNYPNLSDNDTDAILQQYPMQPAVPLHAAWFPSAALAFGEATFNCAGVHALNSYNRALGDTPAWGYRYNVQDDVNNAAGIGVPHVFEEWAIFGPDNIFGTGQGPASYYTYNAPMVPIMMDYWLSFVKTLDPNTQRNPDSQPWGRWGASSSRIVLALDNIDMEDVPDPERQRCDFWKTLAPVTNQKR